MKKNTWTKDEIDFLLENYSTKGIDFCSNHLNYKKSKIYRMSHKLNLKMLPNIKKKYIGKSDKLCNVNPNNFRNIQTKEVSYLLGLIWSDGYVKHYNHNYNIVLTMVEDDINNIKKTLDKIGKWHYNLIKKQKDSWKNTIRVSTNNKRIYDILFDYDFTEKSKKSPNKLLSNIPKELHNYFYLGIIDGDGCFYYKKLKNSTTRQFSISSTYEQDWTYVEELFKSLNVKFSIGRYCKKDDSSSYSSIRVTNKEDIKKIGDFIYINKKNIGLSRKYEKYLQIIE
jgi:hypothetical protein